MFLTLVIVFHNDTVMRIVPTAFRNVFVAGTVLLYLFAVSFHSRNAILALGALFLFYLVRVWRDKMFFLFLSCLLFLILVVIAADDNPLGRLSSVTRLADTVKEVSDLLSGGDAGMERKGGRTYLRFVAMMEAGRIFLERPLSGIAFAWPLAAHNQYLSILAETFARVALLESRKISIKYHITY